MDGGLFAQLVDEALVEQGNNTPLADCPRGDRSQVNLCDVCFLDACFDQDGPGSDLPCERRRWMATIRSLAPSSEEALSLFDGAVKE